MNTYPFLYSSVKYWGPSESCRCGLGLASLGNPSLSPYERSWRCHQSGSGGDPLPPHATFVQLKFKFKYKQRTDARWYLWEDGITRKRSCGPRWHLFQLPWDRAILESVILRESAWPHILDPGSLIIHIVVVRPILVKIRGCPYFSFNLVTLDSSWNLCSVPILTSAIFLLFPSTLYERCSKS